MNRYVGAAVTRKRDGKPGTVTGVEQTISRGGTAFLVNLYTITFTAGDEFPFVGNTSAMKSFFRSVDGIW